jgi:hypothetical protein
VVKIRIGGGEADPRSVPWGNFRPERYILHSIPLLLISKRDWDVQLVKRKKLHAITIDFKVFIQGLLSSAYRLGSRRPTAYKSVL